MPASAIARLITAAALALCAAVAHAAALCDPNHLNEQACLEQANQGNAQAQRTLAYIYYRGAGGVAQNRQKGVQWMQRAAENGDAAAQYNLGLMYLAGSDVPHDEAQGIAWLEKSAINGDRDAAKTLMGIYGQRGDHAKAAFWADKAGVPPERRQPSERERRWLLDLCGSGVAAACVALENIVASEASAKAALQPSPAAAETAQAVPLPMPAPEAASGGLKISELALPGNSAAPNLLVREENQPAAPTIMLPQPEMQKELQQAQLDAASAPIALAAPEEEKTLPPENLGKQLEEKLETVAAAAEPVPAPGAAAIPDTQLLQEVVPASSAGAQEIHKESIEPAVPASAPDVLDTPVKITVMPASSAGAQEIPKESIEPAVPASAPDVLDTPVKITVIPASSAGAQEIPKESIEPAMPASAPDVLDTPVKITVMPESSAGAQEIPKSSLEPLQAAAPASAPATVAAPRGAQLCAVYSSALSEYELRLFLAENEREFDAARPRMVQKLLRRGLDMVDIGTLLTPRFNAADARARAALNIPYEMRLQQSQSEEYGAQVQRATQAYYEECVMQILPARAGALPQEKE